MATSTAGSNPRQFIQWKILLICPSANLSRELTHQLSEQLPFANTVEMKDYPARADLAEAMQAHQANLCLVDVASNKDWALSIISDLSALDSKLPIVALHQDNDPDFILRCLRMGSQELLLSPVTNEQFLEVIDRVALQLRNGRGAESVAKVILVMPAKGACGASTIAWSLAYQWKRMGAKRILLADLDPLTGTIAFQLKLKQTYSFMDALSRQGALDEDIWRGLVTTHQGVDVLLAPEKPVHGIDEGYDPSGLIEYARMNYDVVIADCGSPYGKWHVSLARLCDDLLLVTTNELPALQASQRAMAYLERQRFDRSRAKVVVNRYNKEIGMSEDVIEAALHAEVFLTVPSEYETLQRALVEGKPPLGTTSLGRSIAVLAERLHGKQAVKAEKEDAGKGGIGSLFASLLGGKK